MYLFYGINAALKLKAIKLVECNGIRKSHSLLKKWINDAGTYIRHYLVCELSQLLLNHPVCDACLMIRTRRVQ